MHSETSLFLFLISPCRQTHLLQHRRKPTSKTPHDTEALRNCRRMGFLPGHIECLLYLSIYFLRVSCLLPHWIIHRHVGVFTGFLVWFFSFGGFLFFLFGVLFVFWGIVGVFLQYVGENFVASICWRSFSFFFLPVCPVWRGLNK